MASAGAGDDSCSEMRKSLSRVALAAAAVFVALIFGAPAAAAEQPRVLAVEFAGAVNPVSQRFIVDQIERANREGYEAVVLLTDTPGGLDSSMREIIKAELASKVPVVLYVYPPGSRAASAGVFLAMAADVTAMAPQTNIGSSTPIAVSGEEIPEDARAKIVNDAAAYMRALADEHGRSGEWAESAVRQGSNLPARQALERGVIEFVAPDLEALLAQVDGFETQPKGLVLRTADAEIERVEMSLWKEILATLIDPNLIVLLLSVGMIGILVELWNPGLIFPGAVGAISLIIGLYGLQVLPVSWAGLLLMLLAVGFFAAEVFVTSYGLLALGGAVSFFFGALMLFDPAGEAFQVSVPVALAVAATLAAFAAFAFAKVVAARLRPPQTGAEQLVGQVGIARETLDPLGFVLVNGELWRARTSDLDIPAGSAVRVERVDGLLLEVAQAGELQRAA
jgi:membrane-bound serine protease (ClpP class)